MTRDGTAKAVSRDQILRRERGQGKLHFPCSTDNEQDWKPYPVDQYSAESGDHTYIHTYAYNLDKTCHLWSHQHSFCVCVFISL